MIVCQNIAKDTDCSLAKDESSQMIAASHLSTRMNSYKNLKNRKKDQTTWNHVTSPPFRGSSYPAAGVATIPSTGGAE